MQEDNHIFQGLRRDNHQIRQDAKFLWDAHNIRLTNREDSTLLSLTNEKGTKDENIVFKEYYVGHCVLGKYLIVFTASDDNSNNYIYRVEKTDAGYKTIILFYEANVWDKGWNPNHPIEAIGVYETELVQKVYWVDGVNQPRVINIAKPELKLPKYIDIEDNEKQELLIDGVNLSGPDYSQNSNINEYLSSNLPKGLYLKGSFDFVRDLQLQEKVDVTKIYGQGEFSPGTIQYAISYYNKYEQESNICYVTPLYYISPNDRGGNPEEKVSNSFKIEIWGADINFDYVRIYSIHRTSIDAEPTIKVVEDIPVKLEDPGEQLQYIDTGTTGYNIDTKQLLYVGGVTIVANCITQKDRTLFLGNITQKNDVLLEKIKDIALREYAFGIWYKHSTSSTPSTSSVYYDYTSDLSGSYSAGFTAGETYRCGIQVQYKDGKWSEPIFVEDYILCDENAWESAPLRKTRALTLFKNGEPSTKLRDLGVRRVRACIVFPRASERNIICQGIICPTVYSVSGRRVDSPYAVSSWFFRPATGNIDNESDVYHGASIQFQHNKALFSGTNRGAEIQNMLTGADTLDDISSKEDADKYSSHFFVDENIVTFHSPDLEFDTALKNYIWDGVQLRIIGMAKLGAISGDIDIQTSSPPIQPDSPGFIHSAIGYQTRNNYYINGGLIMAPFYRDYSVKSDFTIHADSFWPVYPWNRSGSLNNDSRRPDNDEGGTQSAVLSKKKISNLKFFDKNTNLDSPICFDISTPQMFLSNEVSMLKLSPAYLRKEVPYLGNVDTLITSGQEYNLYISDSFTGSFDTMSDTLINKSNNPVRMKYKSSPHLVFSLGKSTTKIPLLPRHATIGNVLNGDFTFPNWQQSGSSDGSNDDRHSYDYIMWLYCDKEVDGLYYHPTDNRIGTCSIGTDSSSGKQYIVRADKSSSGNKWIQLNNSDGIILKVTAGVTTIYGENNYLPNTTAADYPKKYIYKGKDRYYKVITEKDSTGESTGYCTLEDVTDSFESRAAEEAVSRASSAPIYKLEQKTFGDANDQGGGFPYMLIGELVRPNVINKFGGTSKEALQQNLWIPAGRPVNINNKNEDIIIPFEYGDTWYSRYDCLKTYPFTQEDENSIIEIGSFMCETRVNIDGRYDKNRGQLSNLNMTPQNFNLMNEVYSQKDNFFNYRKLDEDYYKQHKFANQITWSKEKSVGEEVDTWANITLANTLDMNGEKGSVTALKSWNEYLLCFQEKALSQILFNSRVQIPATDGIPIEISNGYKVDGSRLFSDNIGCSNKWTTAITPVGIYFLDSNTDSLYIFNGQLTNLSRDRGMDWWVKQNHTDKAWLPVDYGRFLNGIRTFYDNKYGDVYFTPGPVLQEQPDALCYSEQLGQFTSLMSYGGTQAMFNFADGFYSLKQNEEGLKLYQNNAGSYNNFYGTPKGWSFSFISNQNPTLTKIFDTIELRTDHYLIYDTEKLLNSCPMNYIEVDNEYQHSGIVPLTSSNMRKKFRVWRGLLPRNKGTRQRIRNPWSMITLGWNPINTEQSSDNTKKAVVHDVSVKYTV